MILDEQHLVNTTKVPDQIESVISLGKPETEFEAREVRDA